nr:hypothetical protein CFP56_04949 [Quercus suber]
MEVRFEDCDNPCLEVKKCGFRMLREFTNYFAPRIGTKLGTSLEMVSQSAGKSLVDANESSILPCPQDCLQDTNDIFCWTAFED